jgi:P27 family predicted phage terminase small subunit
MPPKKRRYAQYREVEPITAEQSPAPVYVDQEPPTYLDQTAREEWQRQTSRRTFQTAELGTLAVYCSAFSSWRAAEDIIAVEGRTIKATGSKGQPLLKEHPLLRSAERHLKMMLRSAKALRLDKASGERPLIAVNWATALEEIDTLSVESWEAKYRCSQRGWLGGEFKYLPGELLN